MKYIDLFSGVGGFHLAMESFNFDCVLACEKDTHARSTYISNFSDKYPELLTESMFPRDISKLQSADVPDFDFLCAGFPCQAFSNAGHKKGFEDTRGTLFFDVARILKDKMPSYFLLENVKNLAKHDNGKTLQVITTTLKELGYTIYYQVLNSADYGLPQMRKRIYIVGFKDKKDFTFPEKKPLAYTMSDVFGGHCEKEIGYTLRCGGRLSPINDRHNWDGYIVDGVVKRLGVDECKKMQGFPEDYNFPVSHNQALKQLGNSVSVPVIKAIIGQMLTA